MKALIMGLLLSQVAFAGSEIVLSPVDHLYVPKGFDSNDSVELVVTGIFPNACYSRNDVQVTVQGEQIDVTITAIASEKVKCIQMQVPYKEVIPVGNLQAGEYQVRINQKLNDSLVVEEASSSAVDNYTYASVDWVEQKSQNDFVLHGWKYSDCIEMKKIEVVSNNKDTLSVLPVMKQTSDFCPMKGRPFSYPVKIDFSSVKMQKPLLHVRTMDGKSVNQIVNLEANK